MSAPTDKKPEEKKKGLSTKAKLWIIGVSLLVVPLLIWLCTEPSPEEVAKKLASSATSTIPHQVVTVTVTDATNEINIPFGMNINFKLRTKDVVWWVQPGDGKVFERPPINSPRYKDIDYGNKFESIKVWVAPGTTAELAYYFTPA